MNIPRHWARAKGTGKRPDGTALDLTAWGWSASDPGEAHRAAQDRLHRMMARVAAGDVLPDRYPYGVRALREEIVEHVGAADDDGPAVVTRNTYGSLVMNARDVMFVDIDVSEAAWSVRLRRFFSRKRDPVASASLQKLQTTLASVTNSAFRIYETAGGYRLMSTERTFAPGSSESERLMEAVGADPAYVQLCRAQRSFRARLTPKPWRCGHTAPPNEFPRGQVEQAAFEDWLRRYNEKCSAKAVCRFVGEVGNGHVATAVAPVLRYHDQQTRAYDQLPLA